MRPIPAAIIATVILGLTTAQAFAHAQLVSSTPLAGAAVTSPARIVLKFDGELVGKLSGGEIAATRMMMAGKMVSHIMKIEGVTAALDPSDPKTLIITPNGRLGAGEYKLSWHAASADTHRETGAFTFTVK